MATHVEANGFSRKRKAEDTLAEPAEKSSSPSVTSQAPRGINVEEFAEARALELHNMVQEMSAADRGSKRVFQSLPKHMRRRAASHNSKRLPVRLRGFMKLEETNQQETQKKKSRRQRRRPKSLLDEYNRRKKQNVWLESHIWHAKRMKMVNLWGYRLAEQPSDKSFKACHRAVASACLLQDISYYSCIEIKGCLSDIVSAMSLITRQELGPTMASVEYMNTGKEGHVMLYHHDQYPNGAIGPVSFMWRQHSSNHKDKDSKLSQLWIWVHPSCYVEVLEEIQNVCSCKSIKSFTSTRSKDSTDSDSSSRYKEESQSDGGLTVTSLRFDLVRLRLVGPLAHPLLAEMLKIDQREIGANKESKDGIPVNESEPCESNNNSEDSHHHGDKQVKDTDFCSLSSERIWASMKSASCSSVIPPHSTLALTVIDPRLSLPGKRIGINDTMTHLKSDQNAGSMSSLYSKWPSHVAASNLWDAKTRQQVKESKPDDHQINSIRSMHLLPGTQLDLGAKASQIPILLVHQPGIHGYGAGWDIILPAGWTMPFWISLVYRGARVGGLRESRNCALESEVPYFPHDVPDTHFGKEYNDKTQREGESKYLRYPPNKRPNYHKLGITSPFSCPWNKLIKEWTIEGEKLMTSLDCNSMHTNSLSSKKERNDDASVKAGKSLGNVSLPKNLEVELTSHSNKSKQLTSGNEPCRSKISDNTESILNHCRSDEETASETFYVLRDNSELKSLRNLLQVPRKNNKKFCHRQSEEKVQTSPVLKIMKDNQCALVGVSLRMINHGCPKPNATISIPTATDLKELQQNKKFGGHSEPLHKGPKQHMTNIVSNSKTMIGCCTRKVIGYVTSGNYSLSRGCGVAIAYCALPGLVELLSTGNQGVVLIRNTSSQQYRFAYLTVL